MSDLPVIYLPPQTTVETTEQDPLTDGTVREPRLMEFWNTVIGVDLHEGRWIAVRKIEFHTLTFPGVLKRMWIRNAIVTWHK